MEEVTRQFNPGCLEVSLELGLKQMHCLQECEDMNCSVLNCGREYSASKQAIALQSEMHTECALEALSLS